jgi:hypothetical protein
MLQVSTMRLIRAGLFLYSETEKYVAMCLFASVLYEWDSLNTQAITEIQLRAVYSVHLLVSNFYSSVYLTVAPISNLRRREKLDQ